MRIPFVGPTYAGRSSNIDSSRCINFFPELGSPDSKSVSALIGTFGTSLFCNAGTGPIRGTRPFNGGLFFVRGSSLYSVDISGVVSPPLGTLSTSSGNVSMADNGRGTIGNQLIIVDGASGYIYNVVTSTFTVISGGGWPGAADVVAFLDGYFIVNGSNSNSYFVSNLYDGTTWSGVATSPTSSSPDIIQSILTINQQLIFVKQYNMEFWYDAGIPTSDGSPFQRIPGSVVDYGSTARWSVSCIGNSIFMLGTQRNNNVGEFIGAIKIQGYSPEVISPPAITYRLSQLTSLGDALSFSYAIEGHVFYVLTFPTGNATLVYDDTTKMWHEWSTYGGQTYSIGRHRSNTYAYFNGKHYVGDYANGNIYELSSSVYDDYGSPIVSIRTSPCISDKDNLDNHFVHRINVDIESGAGSSSGDDPQSALSWSDDGGHVWSNDYPASMGSIGQYLKRLIWRRLGYSRSRIFRLVMADKEKKVVISAGIEATKGTS